MVLAGYSEAEVLEARERSEETWVYRVDGLRTGSVD